MTLANDAKNPEQIARIQRMEETLDAAVAALAEAQAACARLAELEPDIAELVGYWQSDTWMEDFAADEAGLLPADLKRGVLSEDGVYNFVTAYAEFCGQTEDPE